MRLLLLALLLLSIDAEARTTTTPFLSDEDPKEVRCDAVTINGENSAFNAGSPDGLRAVRKTLLALRIQLIAETWDTADPNATSIEDSYGEAFDELTEDPLRAAFCFAIGDTKLRPADEKRYVPSEAQLRDTYTALWRARPRPDATSGTGARDVVSSERESFNLGVLLGRGTESLTAPVTLDAGTGVSFEQALIEGATAFLLDRARADLARAGLDVLGERIGESPFAEAFEHTFDLAGYGDAGTQRNRDPRLYLEALQAALVADFEGLPQFLAEELPAGSVGSNDFHWKLAGRAIYLVDDVQRGTHPLLALSQFGAYMGRQDAAPQDDNLKQRIQELGVLAGVIYAGQTELDGETYKIREVLRRFDGRRLFVQFLLAELHEGVSIGSAVSEAQEALQQAGNAISAAAVSEAQAAISEAMSYRQEAVHEAEEAIRQAAEALGEAAIGQVETALSNAEAALREEANRQAAIRRAEEAIRRAEELIHQEAARQTTDSEADETVRQTALRRAEEAIRRAEDAVRQVDTRQAAIRRAGEAIRQANRAISQTAMGKAEEAIRRAKEGIRQATVSYTTTRNVEETILQAEARVTMLLATLDDIVTEVQDLKEQFTEIQVANPSEAGNRYAAYVAVVTRAVRQILAIDGVSLGGNEVAIAILLDNVETLLDIREAAIRADYAEAVALALPYIDRIAQRLLGTDIRTLQQELEILERGLRNDSADLTIPDDQRRWALSLATATQTQVNSLKESADKRHTFLEQLPSDHPELLPTDHPLITSSETARDRWGSLVSALSDLVETLKAPPVLYSDLQIPSEHVIAQGRSVAKGEQEFLLMLPPVLKEVRGWANDRISRTDLGEVLETLLEYLPNELNTDLFAAAAAIASSDSAEDVYQALVLFAAPPGSFRDKRGGGRDGVQIALNAYVGGIIGAEYADGSDGLHGGAFIPVGVEFVTSVFGGSLGLFLAPLNLGTYVDYSSEEELSYSFAQIWSPGAYLVAGVSERVPLSLGLGISYVPNLRENEAGVEVNAFRASLFLAVDIPLVIW